MNEEQYSEEHRMLGVSWAGPDYHTRVPQGAWVHPTRESLDYALNLLKSESQERAAAVVRKVLELQDTDPTSETYGIWPWLLEEPLSEMDPPDWNWADFCGARLAQMLVEHAGVLPGDLIRDTRTALGHAAATIFRRNVGPAYTNIAVMGAGVTLAAGELLDEPRLSDYGRRRLRNIVEHTEHHGGFNEYNSPTYTVVTLSECERMLQLVRDPSARADAEMLRLLAWRTIAERYHPGTHQWSGPHSRAYSDRLDAGISGFLSERTGVEVRPHPKAGLRDRFEGTAPLPCPSGLVDRFRSPPHGETELRSTFIRRAGEGDSIQGTTWMSEDACLGSVSRDNLWDQRHARLGYWRTEEDPAVVLRLRFLHDGRDFSSACARNAQSGPRILSAIGLLTGMGDAHHQLDRTADGAFDAEDFRVRYELVGEGVAGRALEGSRFELSAGSCQAIVHTAPGRFGPHELVWEMERAEGRVCLDGVCYRGPRRRFEPVELGDVVIFAGLELLRADQPPSASGPAACEPDGGMVDVSWPVAGGLRILAPTRAQPYP
ncbi:MAG TPA: hypothetical protein VHM69_04700 [Rubrobacter sp.]|nr:hypothetical protein [Rubrobacter sp.]